jgi:hypothetical protein
MVGPVRVNEVTRAAEVLEHQRAGNVLAALAALQRLWIEMPERPGEDLAAAEAWQAMIALGAQRQAAEAGMGLLRAGTRIRPHGFVDVAENVDVPTLLELARIVEARSWEPYPYLAAVYMQLIAQRQEAQLGPLFNEQGQWLLRSLDGWVLGAFVVTASFVGDNEAVRAWMNDGLQREGVPMWVRAARIATICQEALQLKNLPRVRIDLLCTIAQQACDTAVWDESARLMVALQVIDAARHERWDEVKALAAEHRERLEATPAWVEHPMIRYANAVKHARPITREDLMFRRYMGASRGGAARAGLTQGPRPPHMQLIELIQEQNDLVERVRTILPTFVEMLDADAPRAIELMRAMAKAKISTLPWLAREWRGLVKRKVPWLTRMKFEMFG